MMNEQILTSTIQIAQLVFIACCIFGVSSLVASISYLGLRKYIVRHGANINHQGIIFLAVSALCASTFVTIWLSLPHFSKLPFVLKHCHDNNCATHIPAAFDQTLLNLLSACFVAGMAMLSFVYIRSHRTKLENKISSLLRLSQTTQSVWSQTTMISASKPIFLNVGIIEPRFLVSSNIVESLDENDVKLLFAYEYAKAKQFESLKIKLIQFSCLFWISHARRRLITDLRTLIHERAYQQVKSLLSNQQANIPNRILRQLPEDIAEFVLKTHPQVKTTPKRMANDLPSMDSTMTTYTASAIYFVGLVVITSNVIHFIFEFVS